MDATKTATGSVASPPEVPYAVGQRWTTIEEVARHTISNQGDQDTFRIIVWEADGERSAKGTVIADIRSSYADAVDFAALKGLPGVRLGLSDDTVRSIVQHTLAGARPTMRVVIGDRTPRQYDRADQMAEGIERAVLRALSKVGLYRKEDQ